MIHTEPARNETKHDKGSSEVYKVNSKVLRSQLIRSLHIYEATLNVHDGDMYLVRGQLTFPLAKTFILAEYNSIGGLKFTRTLKGLAFESLKQRAK